VGSLPFNEEALIKSVINQEDAKFNSAGEWAAACPACLACLLVCAWLVDWAADLQVVASLPGCLPAQ
jgi:hypothetical protein